MKDSNISNEIAEQNLSPNEKGNYGMQKSLYKGTVTVEKKHGTIKFERQLSYPKEKIWNAITDLKEIFRWFPDYQGTIEVQEGGEIDLINTVSGSHVTGNILVLNPYHVFEYEWHISPNQMFPIGEPESVIRWELYQERDSETRLTVTHNYLAKCTALNFAPGWHAYLDRREAILNNQEPPDWARRFTEVKKFYSLT